MTTLTLTDTQAEILRAALQDQYEAMEEVSPSEYFSSRGIPGPVETLLRERRYIENTV